MRGDSESFSALDSHLRWKLEMELTEVFSKFENPVLYVSHNRDEVYRLCDNIVVMNAGKPEVSEEKWDLFKNPRTVQAARLTGCKNIAKAEKRGREIHVPDWDITLKCEQAQDSIGFVGIRANYIVPAGIAKENEVAAVLPFEIVSEIEDTFTNILMVRRIGTKLPPIRWEMRKKDRAALREMPQELALLWKHVLLLN